jgi:Prolyl oligopeptidase family
MRECRFLNSASNVRSVFHLYLHFFLPVCCVVFLGPHSCFDCSFFQSIAFLALSGFQVLLVNYRGSIGFGQDWVEILCGQCGSMDVEDCFNAARQVIMQPKYEGTRVVLRRVCSSVCMYVRVCVCVCCV